MYKQLKYFIFGLLAFTWTNVQAGDPLKEETLDQDKTDVEYSDGSREHSFDIKHRTEDASNISPLHNQTSEDVSLIAQSSDPLEDNKLLEIIRKAKNSGCFLEIPSDINSFKEALKTLPETTFDEYMKILKNKNDTKLSERRELIRFYGKLTFVPFAPASLKSVDPGFTFTKTDNAGNGYFTFDDPIKEVHTHPGGNIDYIVFKKK